MNLRTPEQVDVVVLGGGLAGCAALLAAAETGCSAVLLEKRAEIGGSTALSAGLAAYAGTDEQTAQGIDDSPALLRSDLLETGEHRNDPTLVSLYCEHQLETYRWLKRLGVRYGSVHPGGGQSVPRSHPTDSIALLQLLTSAAQRAGASVLTRVAARRLICEEGRVSAVEVDDDGQVGRVSAGAVIVATGGFSRNDDLIDRFAPQMSAAVRGGAKGCQGDGLLMAWQCGAGIVDMPHIKGTYGIHPQRRLHDADTGMLPVYKGGIAVNSRGERFVNESLPYKHIGDVNLRQPGASTYQVFDATIMAEGCEDIPMYDFASRARGGLIVAADNLSDLEDRLELPPGSLQRTVAVYNDAIGGSAPDEFGRKYLSGKVGKPTPIETPPYYAYRTGTLLLATYCGLTVGPDMRVVDIFGSPIAGLYAAGEVAGGLHGAGYMTGSAIGKAAIFGRLAGRSAAHSVIEHPNTSKG